MRGLAGEDQEFLPGAIVDTEEQQDPDERPRTPAADRASSGLLSPTSLLRAGARGDGGIPAPKVHPVSVPTGAPSSVESAQTMPLDMTVKSAPSNSNGRASACDYGDDIIHDTVTRRKKRRFSDPSVKNLLDGKDASMCTHFRHDHETRQVIRQLSGYVEVEEVMEGVLKNMDMGAEDRQNPGRHAGRIYSHLRNYQQVESQRLSLKMNNGMMTGLKTEAWKDGDLAAPHPDKAQDMRTSTKDSRRSNRASSQEDSIKPCKEHLDKLDWLTVGVIGFLSFSVVIGMCVWAKEGLLAEHDLGHAISANTRQGHIHAAIYTTPAVINLAGTEKDYFEVRLVGMATMDFTAAHAKHRRLQEPGRERPRTLLSAARMLKSRPPRQLAAATGTIRYQLYKCNTKFYERTVELLENEELEHFQDVNVAEELSKNSYPLDPGLGEVGCSGQFFANVTALRSDGQESAFMLQVVRMSSAGRYRQVIGILIFVTTFVSIVSERIHRSYSAFLGASATLCTLSAIQETPHLHQIVGMIDWGTLMLLFSMMILMRMLAVTGFFNWFAVKVVMLSKQNTKVLFFALTNICGILSMVLDNVTCVMLFGPLTYLLSKKMGLNPRWLYLSMTICATVGGTGTLIGDPPNVVIGSKMKIDFGKFLVCNLPVVVVVMLPLCSVILYWRTKDMLHLPGVEKPKLDFDTLQRENRITDFPMFIKLLTILFAILLSLCLSPLHKIEPSWFTTMGMFACAILFERHKLGKYLEFVEWDTLLFFALLFVLVESLSELGVIRMLGEWIIAMIEVFPEGSRMSMAIIIILWVSSLGSAFLESLPYTTTIVYILIDLQRKKIDGIDDPSVLIWPLSVGACVGGIGSIMGSSANLVCMAVAERCAEREDQKVQGGDFLKYGLPTMLVLVVFAMFWQLLLFVGCGYRP